MFILLRLFFFPSMEKWCAVSIDFSQLTVTPKMFISTNFYQRVFKQIMGVPPAQFLRDIRVSEACRLLANTDMSVQDIAEKCGFNCASYFIHVIKKQLGVTPLEYRKANRMLL